MNKLKLLKSVGYSVVAGASIVVVLLVKNDINRINDFMDTAEHDYRVQMRRTLQPLRRPYGSSALSDLMIQGEAPIQTVLAPRNTSPAINILIAGHFISDRNSESHAVVSIDGGRNRLIRIGDVLQPIGVEPDFLRLIAIESNHLVLSNSRTGREMIHSYHLSSPRRLLSPEEDAYTNQAVAHQHSASSPASMEETINPDHQDRRGPQLGSKPERESRIITLSELRDIIPAESVDEIAQRPGAIMNHIQVTPSREGFRLNPRGDGALFNALGLEPGDRVVEINSERPTSIPRAMAMIRSIDLAGDKIELVVERRGILVEVRIQQ